ncbi:FeS assembly protein SufD [Acidilobus saccharovorans 345-15]|uniref:FeS assembly protein SufD n=2 Tax=Acidilobus TaxID=105850 RepID=D9Q2Z6_ACIS3|nr:FeS assembly protein SufD [Acidilobus saccharovorans 345-15]
MNTTMTSLLVERARRIASTALWQAVADSPTTKNYTNWRLFEEALNLSGPVSFSQPKGSWDMVLGPCGASYNYDIDESVLDLSAFKLYAEHVARLAGAHKLEPTSGTYRIALCRPEGDGWYSYHLLINVNEGVSANILVYAPRASPGTTGIEVRAKRNSNLNLVIVAEPQAEKPMAFILRRALGVGAKVRSTVVSGGSVMTRVDEQSLLSSGSQLVHRSFVASSEGQTVDDVIDTVQTGHDSTADVTGFGFSSGRSLVSVRGTVIMNPQSYGSSSSFVVEALLLSEESRAYTMPMMRIDTGDIRAASHRAAQYRVPLDQLFYLESRGLNGQEAFELLLRGKLQSTLDGLPAELTFQAEDLGVRLIKKAVEAIAAKVTPQQEARAPS